MKRLMTLAFIFMAAFSGCSGEEGAEDKGLLIPIQGDYIRYAAQIQELSGLCLHTDGSFLWGVGDQGTLAKIGFDGKVRNVLTRSFDMEGITINPETGDLYIGCEPGVVYKVVAPDYKITTSALHIEGAKDYGNSGVEGISWYKDGMLLVGAQTGANMWAYRLDGTMVWRKSLRSVASGISEIADICYDPVKDQIWVIDSDTQTIYLFDGEANTLLATYKVPYGGNCESVCLDYNNSCVWVADDDDNSKLYKINFTF